MKKLYTTLCFLIVFILVISIGMYNVYQKYGTIYYTWEQNWKMKVPKGQKMTTVFDTLEGRDGEVYTIIDYDDQNFPKLEQLNIWNSMDGKSYSILSKRIQEYQNIVQQLHKQELNQYKKFFLNYPVRLDRNSLWYVMDKEDGSYVIVILNVNQKKLYVMENFY